MGITDYKLSDEDLQTLQDVQDAVGADGLLFSLLGYLAGDGFEELSGQTNQTEIIHEFARDWRGKNEPEPPQYYRR